MAEMKWTDYVARLTGWAFAGALIGLVAGLILLGLDVVDNPFWAMSAGIFVGAVLMPVERSVAGRRRASDAD